MSGHSSELQRDPRHRALSLLEGQAFHHAEFRESWCHDFSGTCRGCSKEIAEVNRPNAEHFGYVFLRTVQYDGFPPHDFYCWVCEGCFHTFRDEFQWTVADGPPPSRGLETNEAFHRAFRAYQKEHAKSRPPVDLWARFPNAPCGFHPDDIVGIGRVDGITLTKEEAVEFLVDNEQRIRGWMSSNGYDLIRLLLQRREQHKTPPPYLPPLH